MLGDLNIDLLKYEEHRLTSSFLDMLYSNNVFPLTTKPTGVTQTNATLIDHVLTNNFDVWGNIVKVYYVVIYQTTMLYFILLVTLCVNLKIVFHQQWNVTCSTEMYNNSLMKCNKLIGKL